MLIAQPITAEFNSLSINAYRLPDGELGFTSEQIAEAVSSSLSTLREWNVPASNLMQRTKARVPDKQRPVELFGLPTALAYWRFLAPKQNARAIALVKALDTQLLTMVSATSDPVSLKSINIQEWNLGFVQLMGYELDIGSEILLNFSADQMAVSVQKNPNFVTGYLEKKGILGTILRGEKSIELTTYSLPEALEYWQWQKSMGNDKAASILHYFSRHAVSQTSPAQTQQASQMASNAQNAATVSTQKISNDTEISPKTDDSKQEPSEREGVTQLSLDLHLQAEQPFSSAEIQILFVDPKTLKPHPRNQKIYGSEPASSELVELILASGWIRPLLVTPKQVIISGHRRWKAALQLGLDLVPVEVRPFRNRLAELEVLLLENASRPKTREQKVREANAWKEIETAKAKERQLSGLKIGNEFRVQKNFSGRDKGQTRDLVAAKVELGSGVTYVKAAKVVSQIDRELKEGDPDQALAWRKILNEQSVEAAHQLLKLSSSERQKILDLIATGEAETTKEAKLLLHQAAGENQQNYPFQVGELAVLSMDPAVAASLLEVRWNGYWGKIENTEAGSAIALNLGAERLRVYSQDLEPIENPSEHFQEIAHRVLRVRTFPLEEIEIAVLDVLQRSLNFTPRQLAHLKHLENLCQQIAAQCE